MLADVTTVRCCVDWIEVAVVMCNPTNLQAFRSRCGFASAFSFDDETGERLPKRRANAGTRRFSFRVQSPERWAAVVAAIERVLNKFEVAETPRIVGIEVALDLGINVPNKSELAEVVAELFMSQSHLVSTNYRLYRDHKGSVIPIPAFRDSLIRHLAEGYQIGIGDEFADRYVHLYLKTTDDGGKALLEASDWRARYEVRIQGDALPTDHLSEWSCFDFSRLTKPMEGGRLFNVRQIDPASTAIEQALFDRPDARVALARRRPWKLRDADGKLRYRKHSHRSSASPLNKRIDSALRNLTARWSPSRVDRQGSAHGARQESPIPEISLISHPDTPVQQGIGMESILTTQLQPSTSPDTTSLTERTDPTSVPDTSNHPATVEHPHHTLTGSPVLERIDGDDPYREKISPDLKNKSL